jgi:dTDP-D-glucose 4,6-dehydratase
MAEGGARFIGANFVRVALWQRSGEYLSLTILKYAGTCLDLREVERNARCTFLSGDITDRGTLQLAKGIPAWDNREFCG